MDTELNQQKSSFLFTFSTHKRYVTTVNGMTVFMNNWMKLTAVLMKRVCCHFQVVFLR